MECTGPVHHSFYPSFVKDVLKLIREERVKANNSPNFPVGIKVKLKETIFKMSYPFEDDDDERLVDGICTFSLDWSGRTEARRAHFNRWLEYEKTTEPYSPSPSPSPSTPSSPSSRIGQPSLPFTEEDVQSHPYAKPTFDLRQLLIQGTSFVYIGTSIPSNQQDDILKLIASCFNSLDHHQNLPDLKDGVVRWGSRGFGEGAWKYVVSTLFDVKKGEDGRTTKRKRVETVGSSESGWSLTEKYKNAKPFPDYSITSSDEFLNNPVVNIINSYNGTDGIVKMIDRFGKFNDDSEGFTREMHRLVDKIAEVGCSNHNGKGLYNCVFSHANPDYKTYGVPEMAYESPYGEQDSIVVGLDDDNEEVMGTAIFCQGCATGVNIVFDIGKTLLECVAIRSRPGHGSSQTLPRVLGMFSHCGSCSIQRVGNGNSVEDFERVLPFRCNPCGSNKNQKKFLQVLASNAEALLERPDIPVEELTSIQTFIGGSCIQECQTSDCHGVVFRDGRTTTECRINGNLSCNRCFYGPTLRPSSKPLTEMMALVVKDLIKLDSEPELLKDVRFSLSNIACRAARSVEGKVAAPSSVLSCTEMYISSGRAVRTGAREGVDMKDILKLLLGGEGIEGMDEAEEEGDEME